MNTLERPTVYDRAFFGEPLERLVRHPTLNTEQEFWTVGDWAIVMPTPVARPAPDVQRAIADLRAWTGWSSRRLADLLGTSHTTVLGIEGGRPLVEGHSGDLRRQVADVHRVVRRIFLLSDSDPATTVRVLDTRPAVGESALEMLRRGEPAKAYLHAIDVMRPRPTGLLVGSRPRRGGATAPLHE